MRAKSILAADYTSADLQAYLFAGMKLPSSSDDYERLYPKENCAKLTEVDSGIYEVCCKNMMSVIQTDFIEGNQKRIFGYTKVL